MKIVFIHGAYTKNFCWNYLKDKLIQRDHVFLEYNVEHPVKVIIDSLKRQIKEKCAEESMILIGHSFGGTLSVYLSEIEKIPNIKQVITLSSPLGGVEAAKYVFPPIFGLSKNYFWHNISPHNYIIRSILSLKKISIPTFCVIVKTDKTSISGESDGVVSVKSQSVLKDKSNVKYLQVEGMHMSGLLDDVIIDQIKDVCNNILDK
jgi:esterase/lipase